ncbi:ABC transporter, ATP-binding protein [Eubacterium brachy ATCC 33089]|nr:ABC transporter, ATP-binding protein [Eubacterium brachy ATCC 33089]
MFINKILLKFAKLTSRKIVIAVLIQTMITLLVSITALLTGEMVRKVISSSRGIGIYVIVIIVLLMLIAVISVCKAKIIVNAGIEIKNNVRSMLLQKLFLLGPGYAERKRTGELTSIMTTRVEWLMSYYVLYLPVVVSAIINAVIFVVFLFYVDYFTGVTALFACIAMIVIPMLFFNIMRKRGMEEWNMHAEYYSNCLDGIQGMINLKALGADDWYIKNIKKSGENFRIAVMSHLKITMLEGAFSEFFARIGSALTLVILAIRFSMGEVNHGIIILAFFSVGAAFMPMLALINAWHMGFQGISAAYSIDDLLNLEATGNFIGEAVPRTLTSYDSLLEYIEKNKFINRTAEKVTIEFDDVSFCYREKNKFKLRNISFKIEPNKMVALVGSSGSGKTTIANLLSGFYKKKSGHIRVNGQELSEKNIDKIRSMITAVWQDGHLFSSTIYNNISIGRIGASKIEIEEAAKRAEIHDFILSLPDKYQTDVGENGKLLSAGERQRIVMARAFLKDAPVLVFDEATSSLDRNNEIKIQRNFEKLRKDKTVLVIAHRLHTVLEADEICVLSGGKIIGRGTHEELIKKSELYKKIMGEQFDEK